MSSKPSKEALILYTNSSDSRSGKETRRVSFGASVDENRSTGSEHSVPSMKTGVVYELPIADVDKRASALVDCLYIDTHSFGNTEQHTRTELVPVEETDISERAPARVPQHL